MSEFPERMVQALTELEKKLAKEKGQFSLFGVFLREGAPDVWDLVVSAPWIDEDTSAAVHLVGSSVQATLKPEEITRLSGISVVNQEDPALDLMHRVVEVQHNPTQFVNCVFFGMRIQQAYIITSKRPQSAAA